MDGFDLASTDRLLSTTRTVRKRLDLDTPIDMAEVMDCLRLASYAPSGGNGQRWRWLMVTDPELKRGIAEYYAQAYADYSAPLKAQIASDDNPALRMAASSDFLADNLARVPLLVIPCALERLTPESSTREAASLYGGMFPAVWSFQLALRSRGYGSAITTLHIAFEKEVGDLLGIPDTVTQVALIPVARYTGETFGVAPRRPVEEVVYADRWKNPLPS